MEKELKEKLVEGLENIASMTGAFNRDPIKHAENIMAEHKETAEELLKLLAPLNN